MIIVNRKNDRMTGAVMGKPFNIPFDQETFQDLSMLSTRLEKAQSQEVRLKIIEEAKGMLVVDFKAEVAAANGYLKFRKNTGRYYLVINKDKVDEQVSSIPLPQVLAERIIASYEEKSDFMPIILAWQRFLAKQLILPEFREENLQLFANYLTAEYTDQSVVAELMEKEGLTRETAEMMATISDIAVTNYGLLATYKVVDVVKEVYKLEKDEKGNTVRKLVELFPSIETVDEVTGEITKEEGKPEYLEEMVFTPAIYKDGDKFFCGDVLGYKYKIGQVHILPEDAKREHRNVFGGGGLYAGGQKYIQGYSNNHTETLTCFIDPFDIISFQDDGKAFRTDRLFAYGALIEHTQMKGMYFESNYAKESDARISESMKKTLQIEQEAIASRKIVLDERAAIEKAYSVLTSTTEADADEE